VLTEAKAANGEQLSLEQVRAPQWAGRFQPNTEAVPNFTTSWTDVWLRCTVRNQAHADTRWVLQGLLPSSQEFHVFVVDAAGRVSAQEVSTRVPFAHSHAVPDRYLNVLLRLPKGQNQTLYIHTGSGLLNFRISEQHHLYQLVNQRDIMASLYFGTLLTLILYNLLLFGSVRDRTYLYYVVYVAAFAALQADMMGYLQLIFWPRLNGSDQPLLQMVLLGVVVIFGILTARAFLETRRLLPRLDWLLRGLALVAPLPALASAADWHMLAFWTRIFVPLGTALALLVTGVAVLRTGYKPARYYMAGWALLLLAIIAYYLRTLGVIPVSFLTENGVRIGSALEMVLLSLGLASRINLARQAQQQAQARALAVLREKEEVQEAANRELAARATELKQAYDELRASLATTDQLQTLDELKTRFFTNISHELRTPLTLIISPLEQMLTETGTAGPRPELALMHRNARRLLHLINQLLDIARLEAGSMQLLPVPTDLAAAAQAAVVAFAPLAQAKDVSLHLETPPAAAPLPPLYADPDKLEHIIYNLLSNALKFTPAGGQVWVKVAAAEGQAELTVQDSGIGIADEQLPRVFERFHQADASHTRQYGGSGVGLALVRELVNLHGGSISAASQVGVGSSFCVSLPLGTAHLPAEVIQPAPVNETAGSAARWVETPLEVLADTETDDPDDERPLVLIVDDSADIRQYLRQCLGGSYRLLLAADGEQGLARAQAALPDLVVSDLMMPGLDGIGLCQQLKTDERTSHIPVVLLTARTNEASRLRGLDTGADDYLTKPFRPAELQARVRNLIEQRRQLRQRFGREVTLQPRDISITSADETFLNRALAVVETHLADSDFSAEDFASAMALSRMQLHRKLKALTDQSTTEFVRTLRLRRAADLLAGQVGNVADVAYATGFSNLSYFARCFREQHGQLPSAYAAAAPSVN
jgi:signal transduction histidine kinase/DNA-binding response OmpR family regulator